MYIFTNQIRPRIHIFTNQIRPRIHIFTNQIRPRIHIFTNQIRLRICRTRNTSYTRKKATEQNKSAIYKRQVPCKICASGKCLLERMFVLGHWLLEVGWPVLFFNGCECRLRTPIYTYVGSGWAPNLSSRCVSFYLSSAQSTSTLKTLLLIQGCIPTFLSDKPDMKCPSRIRYLNSLSLWMVKLLKHPMSELNLSLVLEPLLLVCQLTTNHSSSSILVPRLLFREKQMNNSAYY